MPKAIWNGVVLAESDRCEVVEGTNTCIEHPTRGNTGLNDLENQGWHGLRLWRRVGPSRGSLVAAR